MPKERETVITVVTKGLEERAAPTGEACLVVFYGANIGKRYFLEHSDQIIGRSDSANIQVEQESVSRQHAKVTARKDGQTLCYHCDDKETCLLENNNGFHSMRRLRNDGFYTSNVESRRIIEATRIQWGGC